MAPDGAHVEGVNYHSKAFGPDEVEAGILFERGMTGSEYVDYRIAAGYSGKSRDGLPNLIGVPTHGAARTQK
jgi:hypothetical protein